MTKTKSLLSNISALLLLTFSTVVYANIDCVSLSGKANGEVFIRDGAPVTMTVIANGRTIFDNIPVVEDVITTGVTDKSPDFRNIFGAISSPRLTRYFGPVSGLGGADASYTEVSFRPVGPKEILLKCH